MEENTWYTSLEGVLPEGHLLVLDREAGILLRLYCDERMPKLYSLSSFTFNELALLVPLLEQYPAYCPLEVLLASMHGSTTEKAVQKARSILYEAAEQGTWESHLRPMRNLVSRVRNKLCILGIEVLSIQEVGYMLQASRTRSTTHEQ